MKVLIIVPHLRKGGPVDVEYNLCKQLICSKDIQVEVLTLRNETGNSKIEDFRGLGIEVSQLGLPYIKCELFSKKVGKLIQEYVDVHQIDIIHCHGYHPVLACKHLKRVKKVATMHDRATEDFVNVFGKLVGGYMLRRYLSSLKKFDLNIGVSESVADLYKTFIPHVTHVNNGINVDKFFPIENKQRLSLKEKLGLPLDKRIIVSSGRIEKEKHYEELIDWFIHNNRNNVLLLILGNGSRLNKCQEMIGKTDRVMLPGRVSNVDEYLKCADYYISYSESEGMSMAVCEGISCGLLPVLSDIPSHRDVGEAIGGLFFKTPADIDMTALQNVQVDKDKLHAYIRQHFSIESMSQGYLEAYQSVMKSTDSSCQM